MYWEVHNMCQIKKGTEITQMYDVQNLITSCIFRMHDSYTVEEVSNQVVQLCQGSKLPLSKQEINKLVKETITTLLRSQYVFGNSGRYYTVSSSI